VPADPGSSPFLPEQSITVADAWVAFTAGSAYVNHRDEVSGSLRTGATADLVILDGDPFAVGDISTLVVDETIVAGETVYRR
jgi:hypothetical protein